MRPLVNNLILVFIQSFCKFVTYEEIVETLYILKQNLYNLGQSLYILGQSQYKKGFSVHQGRPFLADKANSREL